MTQDRDYFNEKKLITLQPEIMRTRNVSQRNRTDSFFFFLYNLKSDEAKMTET